MSPETTVFLARHGATANNLAVPIRLQGNTLNGPLAPVGVEQATALGEALRTTSVDAVYSSTMLRARQTADLVAAPHRLMSQPIEGLHEISVGQWEGLSWAEIQTRYPNEFQAFFDNPAKVPYLGGECYLDVLARARPAFEALIQQHAGQTIVLVTHNVVNRVLVADFLGLPLDRAKFLHQSNCGFNEIRCRPGIIDVRSVNNDCHVWPWIRTVATGAAGS